MKRFVKFLGVALLATSMAFVACSKDEENDLEPTPAPIPEETSAIEFTFDGVKTVCKLTSGIYGVYNQDSTGYFIRGAKNNTEGLMYKDIMPVVEVKLHGENGSFPSEIDYFYFYNNVDDCVAITNNQNDGSFWPDWGVSSYNKANIDFDAASMTIKSLDFEITMGSIYDNLFNGKTWENNTKKNLTVKIGGLVLTEAQG